MNCSAPVAFVAGGIQQSGKKKEEDEEKSEKTSLDGMYTGNATWFLNTYLNLNLILGYDSNSPTAIKNEQNTSSESDDAAPKTSGFGMSGMAGFRTANQSSTTSVPGAKWQTHNKGIGAKLLLQMGYQPGKGLGKDLQGISQPVQVHTRQGRGAIGAYGPEGGQTIGDGKSTKPKIDEDIKDTQEFQEKMNQWRWRKNEKSSKNAKNRYYYKSVQDIIDKSKQKSYILSDRTR